MELGLPRLLDVEGQPIKQGKYIRTVDNVEYSIRNVERYSFHAKTERFDHVTCDGIYGYAAFARELRRVA
jgi:hypothetical protein